ncbi:hypothetical protein OF83DRAFT_1114961, partial [Amylostereum chailletii]
TLDDLPAGKLAKKSEKGKKGKQGKKSKRSKKPVPCPACPTVCGRRPEPQRHVETTKWNDPAHQAVVQTPSWREMFPTPRPPQNDRCPLCGMCPVRGDSLTRHMENQH